MLFVAILVVGASYGFFFYFQSVAEADFRQSLFEQHTARQIETTKAIAQHVQSDLDGISSKLEVITLSQNVQEGDLSGEKTRMLMQQAFDRINEPYRPAPIDAPVDRVDGLHIVDKNGIVRIDIRAKGSPIIEGMDISFRKYVDETRESLAPLYSEGFWGMDGQARIVAAYPILDVQNSEYLGLVAATVPTASFFRHYGNIYDIQSQYIAVLDSNSMQLVHPVESLVGTLFFDDHTQEVTGYNSVLNSLIRNVLSGSEDHAIYEFVNGQRLTTGHPVYFNGQPVYFVFVITPTSLIYSSIDNILFSQRIQTFTVLASSTAAVVILILLLARWNSALKKDVGLRTEEIAASNRELQMVNAQLEVSNNQLALANDRLVSVNKQLENNEKMQKEFINIAAHELRTPIQPIIGLTEVMRDKTTDPYMHELIDTVSRNAQRLHRLSSDILDVTRIEGQALRLDKRPLEISGLLQSAVEDYRKRIDNGKVKLVFEPQGEVVATVDKERILQVVSNLLDNAIKSTHSGEIFLTMEKVPTTEISGSQVGTDDQHKDALLIKVKDTGQGIDPEVFPKLFTKFVTTSAKGTGLGLFISKGIIDAHGGKIWAKNNLNGGGATFLFMLPLS